MRFRRNGKSHGSQLLINGTEERWQKLPRFVGDKMRKIYRKILKAKMEEEWKPNEAEEQAGFRAHGSTVDNLFCVTEIVEKRMAGRRIRATFSFYRSSKSL